MFKTKRGFLIFPFMLVYFTGCNTIQTDNFNDDNVYFETSTGMSDDFDNGLADNDADTINKAPAQPHNALEMYIFPSKHEAKGYSVKFETKK